MGKLAPSILAADFSQLGKEVATVVEAGADYIHVDVMDGMYVPNISIGPPVIASLRKAQPDIFMDVHLMIMEPLRYIKTFAEAGADLLTVHVEAVKDMKATIEAIRSYDKKVGITLNPGTDLSEVTPYLSQVDLVLVMSVEPGFGGQSFMEDQLDKVRTLVELRQEKGLAFEIEIDGGIGPENLEQVKAAGVDVFVMGSKVFGVHPVPETVKKIKDIIG